MLPRMIDVARAKLPGGDIGQYQIGRGMSALVLGHVGISVDEFVEAVRNANSDEDIASRLGGRRPRAEDRLLNLRMQRATVANVPDDLRKSFTRFYGADLPGDKRLFEVLEEDDARAFAPKAEG
jgi:hypothetical protein